MTDEEAARAAAEANGLLAAEVSLDADGAVTTADAPTRASWIDAAAADGAISPAPSRERVAQWVDAAAAPIERAPISGVDNVDAAGNVLEPARPPKPGRAVTNRDAETDAIVAAMRSHRAHAGRLVAQEVPAPTERRLTGRRAGELATESKPFPTVFFPLKEKYSTNIEDRKSVV